VRTDRDRDPSLELAVELVLRGQIPGGDVEAARACMVALGRYAARPVTAARLALLPPTGLGHRERHVAHAQIVFDGRVLAARAVAPSAAKAAKDAAERLRRQLRRLVDADVATRNEPRVIEGALRELTSDRRLAPPVRLKPPEERAIVPRLTYAREREPTLSAVVDLLDLDEEFHLFSHVLTEEDVVVHRRIDRRIGLLFPPGSALADENGIVIPRASRYSDPIALDTARAEMDLLDHRFLYFVHDDDARGKVLYLRFDGDYGLVHPH
jgi:hypothetical protein